MLVVVYLSIIVVLSAMSMETYSSRASSLFTTFTTVLFAIACLNHLTTYFHTANPQGSLVVSKPGSMELTEFKPYKADQLRFNFDLAVDLSTENHWNLNQIYLFVVASYETKRNEKNEVVVYDRILRTPEEFKFKLQNINVKYPLRDEHKGTLAGREVTLSIRYQVMPIFGLLRVIEIPNKVTIKVPSEYTSGDSMSRSGKK